MFRAIRNLIYGDQLFTIFIGDFPIYPFSWAIEEVKERLKA